MAGSSVDAAPGSGISEQEWRRILGRVADRKVIPVIGEHLTLMGAAGAEPHASLASYLAERLGLPGASTNSLNELAARYLRRDPRGLDDLYNDISQALPAAENLLWLPRTRSQRAARSTSAKHRPCLCGYQGRSGGAAIRSRGRPR